MFECLLRIIANLEQALADALDILGFGPTYHMRVVNQENHREKWTTAVNAVYKGEGEKPNKAFFDDLFQNYEVSCITIWKIRDQQRGRQSPIYRRACFQQSW